MEQTSGPKSTFHAKELNTDSTHCVKCHSRTSSGVLKIERLKMAPCQRAPKSRVRTQKRSTFPCLEILCRNNQIRNGMTTQQTSLALLVTFLACSAYAKIIADEGGPPMVWMGPPPHKLFNAGQVDPIRLPCQASGHPEPRIEWYYNGERMKDMPFPPGQVDTDGTTLLVEGREMEGVYQCKAFNEYGVGLSNTSFLEEAYTDYKPRSFTEAVIKKEVTEGHDVTISCDHVLGSRPKAVIEWRRVTDFNHRGYQVKETNVISQDEEGNLIISRVDRSLNEAMFKCYAANPVKLGSRGGQKTRIIVLTDDYHFNKTRVPNYIYSTQSPHLVLEGDKNVELKCAFGGWPEPTVQWSRDNGMPLQDHVRPGQFSHTLTFDKVSREDDGNYDCWADNGARSSVYQVYLKVEARPVITTPLQSHSVPAGRDVTFTCLADGIPIPQIQWFINDKPINEVERSFEWSVSEDGADLSLFRISLNDTSAIHCNASNVHGYVLASTALRVYPETSTVAPTTHHQSTKLHDIPRVKTTPDVITEDPVTSSTKAPSTSTVSPKEADSTSTTRSPNALPEYPDVKTYKPKDPNAIGRMEKEHGPAAGSSDSNTNQMIILAAVVSIAVIILFGLLIFLILLFRRRRRNYNVTDREYELGYVPGSPEAKPIYSVPEAAPITPPTEASEDQNFIIESTNV